MASSLFYFLLTARQIIRTSHSFEQNEGMRRQMAVASRGPASPRIRMLLPEQWVRQEKRPNPSPLEANALTTQALTLMSTFFT
ncbi:hypothetical protein TNCT_584811 [Trichonephila clavata]|uniref:Uncharacterized protein n=1 Tax=Trichonephila clavata TaxID=2740835 RepID=A0A8X6HME6_TRICU|nr:hypothetical protein TNCT_584811 [Trichonephila clavata]